MSVDSIVVELELKDGKFTSRIKNADLALSDLDKNLAVFDKRVRRVERSVSGLIPRIRDIAIIGASAHAAIRTLNDVFFSWTHGIIRTNAEIERMSVLLQGLSRDSDPQGRLRDAAESMDFLFDKAQRAPFSIKELTNSFVKMKAVGMKDVRSSLNSITDAIANFGGNEETLHRATIALQQMSSKGVVSMEELRQQLGEAVPNAIQLMADGLGMAVGDMTRIVSEGRVKAAPAIEAMLGEMERSMGGSSERMMSTWNGMISQMSTRWTLLQLQVGDRGYFDEAKNGIRDLIDAMDSDRALRFAHALGDGLKSAIDFIRASTKFILDHGDALAKAAKVAISFLAIWKGASTLFTVFIGLSSKSKSLAKSIDSIIRPTKVVQEMFKNVVVSTKTVSVSTTAASKAMGLLGLAVAGLGGTVSAIVAGISTLGAAYVLFGKNVNESIQKVRQSREDLNNVKGWDLKLNTFDQIDEAKRGLEDLKQEYLNVSIAISKPIGRRSGGGRSYSQRQEAIKKANDLRNSILTAEKNIQTDRNEIIERGIKRRLDQSKREIEKNKSQLTVAYRQEISALRKKRDEESAILGKKIADRGFDSGRIRAAERHYEEQIRVIKNFAKEREDELAKISQSSGGKLSEFIDTARAIQSAQEAKAGIIVELSEITSEIEKTVDSGRKEKLISDQTVAISRLNSVKRSLSSLMTQIDLVRNPLDENDIIKAESILREIGLTKNKIDELRESIRKVKQGVDDPIIDKNGVDNGVKSISALRAMLDSARSKLQGLRAENRGDDGGYVEKLRQRIKNLTGDTELAGEAFDSLTNDEKFRKLSDAILKVGVGVQQQQSIKNFNTEFDKLGEKVETAKSKLDQIKGQINSDIQSTWIDEISNQMTEAGVSAEFVGKRVKEARDLVSQLENVNNEKKDIKNARFASEQIRRLDEDILDSKIKSAKSATEAHSLETEKKIANINRLAKKQGLSSNQTSELIDKSREKIAIEQSINIQRRYSEIQKDVARGVQIAKINLMDSEYERQKALLELRFKDAQKSAIDEIGISKNKQNIISQINSLGKRRDDIDSKIARLQSQANAEVSITENKIAAINEIESLRGDRSSIDARIADLQAAADTEVEIERGKTAIMDQLAQQRSLALDKLNKDNKSELERTIGYLEDVDARMSDIGMNFVNDFSDGIAELAVSGKANFKDMAQSIIKQIAAMIVKYLALKAVESTLSIFGFAQGGVAGGAEASGGTVASGLQTSSLSKSITPQFNRYATGGIENIPGMSKQQMMTGGVTNSPKIALFGEASVPEAFIPMKDRKNIPINLSRNNDGSFAASVPLPSGMSIPAKVVNDTSKDQVSAFAKGGVAGSSFTSNANISSAIGPRDGFVMNIAQQNINIDGISEIVTAVESVESAIQNRSGDGVSISITVNESGGESKNKEGVGTEFWEGLADKVKVIVKSEIATEQRPGGSLARSGRGSLF